MSTVSRKQEQLGMPWGTAAGRLRNLVLFQLVQQAGRDNCYKCDEKIESADKLSIEHKQFWLDVSPDLFWDLDNIVFSHCACNTADRYPRVQKHGGLSRYQAGCRCADCCAAKSRSNQQYRLKNL